MFELPVLNPPPLEPEVTPIVFIIAITFSLFANLLTVPSSISSVSNPVKLAALTWTWFDDENTPIVLIFSIVCADDDTVPAGTLPPPPPPTLVANDAESTIYVDTANFPSKSVCAAKLSPDKSTVLPNAPPTPVNVNVEPAKVTLDT